MPGRSGRCCRRCRSCCPTGWSPRTPRSIGRHVNDTIATMVADGKGRFAGLGMVPMQDPDRAVGELERLMAEAAIQGRRDRHQRERRVDRRQALRVVLRGGGAAGRGDLRPCAASRRHRAADRPAQHAGAGAVRGRCRLVAADLAVLGAVPRMRGACAVVAAPPSRSAHAAVAATPARRRPVDRRGEVSELPDPARDISRVPPGCVRSARAARGARPTPQSNRQGGQRRHGQGLAVRPEPAVQLDCRVHVRG